jgi:chromosome partitioning protein
MMPFSLNYDAIVFDCPPGNEYLERLGVVAADVALVVDNRGRLLAGGHRAKHSHHIAHLPI